MADLTPVPTGVDVQVSTFTTNGQTHSSVAALAGGGFVVTWSSFGQDGSSYGIYGQRYNADGTPAGLEFRLNDTTAGSERTNSFYGSETVAALADGRDGSFAMNDNHSIEEMDRKPS